MENPVEEPKPEVEPPASSEREEVDAFGRVARKDSTARSKSRERSRDSRDHRFSRERSRDRDDSRERDRFGGRYDDRGRGGQRRYSGGGGGGGYGRGRFDNRRGGRGYRGYDDRRREPPIMSAFVSMPPMMSFQHFMRNQRDDAAPEEYQDRFKHYQLDYLRNFENCFFEDYRHLEWFQERYDPYKQKVLLDRTADWAREESERFKADLTADPETFIANCRLGPPTIVSSESDSYLFSDSMLWRGLKDRTLVIRGFPGKCSKSIVDTHLRQVLGDMQIQLMAFSDPSKTAMKSFERTVWLTFSQAEDVEKALELLKDMNMTVPEEFDLSNGKISHSIQFPINTQKHTPRPPKKASAEMSDASRVLKDTDQSLTLVELLDAETRVPEETRIGALLQDNELNARLTEPTDKLDLITAYLRRVHCFAYYGGYGCRDVGDMLSSQPHVVHRAVPYREDEVPEPPTQKKRLREEEEEGEVAEAADTDAAPTTTTDLATDAPAVSVEAQEQPVMEQAMNEVSIPVVGSDNDNEREEGEDDQEGRDDEQREEGEEDDDDDNHAESGVPEVSDKDDEDRDTRAGRDDGNQTNFFAKYMDKRVEQRMALARTRIEAFQKSEEPEHLKREQKAVEDAIQAWLTKHTEELPKGLVQCRFEHEKPKKFKAPNFAHKHLLAKHVEILDAELVPIHTPYMRANYDREQPWEKPLPLVSVEAQGGVVNTTYQKLSSQLNRNKGRFDRQDRRGGGRVRGRGGGRRPSGGRSQDLFSSPPSSRQSAPQQRVYMQPRGEDNDSRRLQSYVDMDAPQEMAAGLDYGSAVLPPPRKRRLVKPAKNEGS